MREDLGTAQIEGLGEVLIASTARSGTMRNMLEKKHASSEDFYFLPSCSLQKDECLWLIHWHSWNDPLFS